MIRSVVVFVSILIVLMPASLMAAENLPQDQIRLQDTVTATDAQDVTDNLSLSIGIKTWSIDQTFDHDVEYSGFLFGPSILLIYKEKLFYGLNYFTGKLADNAEGGYDDEELEKTDIDIYVGYSVHPRFVVSLGYRDSKNDHLKFTGPMIDVEGNYPFENIGLIVYGSFEYAYLAGEFGDYSIPRGSAYGFGMELGVSKILASFPQLSMAVAYKLQRYGVDDIDDFYAFGVDNSGFLCGVNYQF